MKKNTFLSLIALAGALMFTSCNEDDIKLDSPNSLTDTNFYQTEADFEIAISGVYDARRLWFLAFFGLWIFFFAR